MTFRLRGAVRLETRVSAHGTLETHAYLDGTELRLSTGILDALALLATGRPLSQSQLAGLVALGVIDDGGGAAPTPHPLTDDTVERLLLRPTVVLALDQPAQLTPAGPIIPESSAPVSMFVPPAALGPLQALAQQLRQAWTEMLRCATARDELIDRERAAEVLLGLTREAMISLPGLADVAELVDDPPRLQPRQPLQSDDGIGFPIAGLVLSDDRVEPRPLASGRELYVPVPDAEQDGGGLADLGRLLGLLHAGMGPVEIGRFLEEAPRARGLFGRLIALELVGAAPARGALADQCEPGHVIHLGHATLLANLGGEHVLIDPWLCPASATDPIAPPAVGDLPPLAGILLTHHHWDHVHVPTLLQLDKRVPIYVPAQPGDRALVPRTARLLRYLGFADVRELAHDQSVPFGSGGQVTAVPFFGEDPTAIGFTGNCYVLSHKGQSALVHVDSAVDRDDRSLVATGAVHALRKRFGPLSPVFATRRQERRSMIDYTWEGLLRPVTDWVAPTENCATGAQFLAELAAATGPTTIVLYSEGGAAWYPEGTNFLPGEEGAAGVEAYQYGWESLDTIFDAVSEVGAGVVVSRPYQRFVLGGSTDGWASSRDDPKTYL